MDVDSLKAVSAAEKAQLTAELTALQQRLLELQGQVQSMRREHDLEKEDSIRRHRLEEDSLRRDFQREIETVTRTLKGQCEENEKKGKQRLEEEIRQRERDVRDIRDREGKERDSLLRDIDSKEREIRAMKNEVENLRADLEREQGTNRQLRVRQRVTVLIIGNCHRTIFDGIDPRSHHPCST
jgi:chromosome segregation ATPase